jgi:hypothetical protein
METASFTGFNKIFISMFTMFFNFLAKLFYSINIKKVVQKAGENFQQQQQYAHKIPGKLVQMNVNPNNILKN